MIFIHILSLTLLFCADSKPFWKEKKEVYQKIVKRDIIVSAKVREKDKSEHLKLISAGHIKAPLEYTKKEIMNFSDYHKITSHFQNIKHKPLENKVYIEVGAFDYYARLWVDYKLEKKTDAIYVLDWQVVRGSFKGLSGKLKMEEYKYSVTEISMHGEMTANEIPIPSALIKIGLEFIGDQMAKKMRSHIEKKYLSADFFEE